MTRVRGSRARTLQVIGAACVGIGLFVALVTWAAFHAPAGVRLGVAVVVLGVVLLAAAAVLRGLRRFRR